MATKRKRSSSKKRSKPAVAPDSYALSWASDHRYGLAAGAIGIGALVYLWPREAQATVPTPTPASPAAPPLTNEQIVQLQTAQQQSFGRTLGIGAFALVAAGAIYYATK